MPGTVIKQLLMERYKQFVETLYKPKEEEILGTILAAIEYWWTRSGSGGTNAEKQT